MVGRAANIPPGKVHTELFDIDGRHAEDLFGYEMVQQGDYR